MDANDILKIDMAQFFETASQADCESLLADVRIFEDKFNTLSRTLSSRIRTLRENAAKERFSEFKEGDKVVVEREYSWCGEKQTCKTEPLFFFDVSLKGRESVYMSNGPFLNLAIPKKDGSMGKRYKSISVQRITKVTKVEE